MTWPSKGGSYVRHDDGFNILIRFKRRKINDEIDFKKNIRVINHFIDSLNVSQRPVIVNIYQHFREINNSISDIYVYVHFGSATQHLQLVPHT